MLEQTWRGLPAYQNKYGRHYDPRPRRAEAYGIARETRPATAELPIRRAVDRTHVALAELRLEAEMVDGLLRADSSAARAIWRRERQSNKPGISRAPYSGTFCDYLSFFLGFLVSFLRSWPFAMNLDLLSTDYPAYAGEKQAW